jgi:peptidoglycan/LPS O-acetylase OafA/YrhL
MQRMGGDLRPAHLHGLDGLRGIACLAVFVDHVEQYAEWLSMPHGYGPSVQALGRQGVELFFVLSGYLITYRLFVEQQARGRVSIRGFYARRALRIWPLYYVVVFAVFAVVPWLVRHAAGPYVRDASGWFLDGMHPFALFVTSLVFERMGLLEVPHARWAFVVAGLAVTLGVAGAAHRFVEVPMLALKGRMKGVGSAATSSKAVAV